MNNETIKILIVEDSPTQALLLESSLQQEGYITRTAVDGEKALALLDEFQPTIIISDIVMPGIDGYELCRQVKTRPGTKDVPVILLTALSDPYDVIQGLQCGADNFITKPYQEKFLLSRIRYILINQELRKNGSENSGVQIYFAGEKISVTSNRIQIVDLLFSSFENAVQKNQELKAVNRELEKTQEQLREAIKEAESANAAKSEFLAHMSHDIRTPMNGIVGMTDLLQSTPMSPSQHEYLDIIQQSAGSLLTLINDILDFSKIEAGKLDISMTPFNLRDYVSFNLKPMAVQADRKGIELACRIDPGVPEIIDSDPHRLGQILTNLIGNAIKFTDSGEIIVRLHHRKTDDGQAEIHFTVEDTGCGIPAEKCASVFEAFSQVEGIAEHVRQGTGLGLAICSKLVDMLGGKIWVESTLGKGSIFHFMITAQTVKQEMENPVRLDSLRILIADDSATALEFTRQILQEAGADVFTVQNPSELIDQLRTARASGHPFDVLIIDTRIPDTDTFAVIRKIRALDFSCYILPALAASTLREDSIQCDELELTHRLTKPLYGTDLLKKIQILTGLVSEKETAGESSQPSAVNPARSLHILVAEDNLVNQMVTTRILNSIGHKSTVAANGQEAVNALEKGNFDLVLMDIKMPIMNGYDATQVIRSSSTVKNPQIPIIALTANAMKQDRDICLQAGMNGYVTKPLQKKDLARAIEELI